MYVFEAMDFLAVVAVLLGRGSEETHMRPLGKCLG